MHPRAQIKEKKRNAMIPPLQSPPRSLYQSPEGTLNGTTDSWGGGVGDLEISSVGSQLKVVTFGLLGVCSFCAQRGLYVRCLLGQCKGVYKGSNRALGLWGESTPGVRLRLEG